MYKNEIKHYINDLEFQWSYQDFKKYVLVLYMVKINIYCTYWGDNRCINNINSMFETDVL